MDSPAFLLDHTLLKPDATGQQIERLCQEAARWQFASVCVPPVFVPLARRCLPEGGVKVGTVVGFPLGYDTPAGKCRAAAEAVAHGADEIDMVIQLGAAREGRLDQVRDEIARVVEAVGGRTVKVIIECCLFDAERKAELTEQVIEGGAAFVKTSTGFAAGGASLEDIRLLSRVAAGRIGVKAAGGIRDWPACRAMIEAGVTRLGSSSCVAIMQQWQKEQP